MFSLLFHAASKVNRTPRSESLHRKSVKSLVSTSTTIFLLFLACSMLVWGSQQLRLSFWLFCESINSYDVIRGCTLLKITLVPSYQNLSVVESSWASIFKKFIVKCLWLKALCGNWGYNLLLSSFEVGFSRSHGHGPQFLVLEGNNECLFYVSYSIGNEIAEML